MIGLDTNVQVSDLMDSLSADAPGSSDWWH